MSTMRSYFISRALVSAALVGFLALLGTPWWLSAASGLLVFLAFLWMTRSGRYVVQPELGATALRRDERTQQISDKAARNAFVVVTLLLAGYIIYSGIVDESNVPASLLAAVLASGALTYFFSDFWMRRG